MRVCYRCDEPIDDEEWEFNEGLCDFCRDELQSELTDLAEFDND